MQIGLICSEKQAIDATLASLAEEDPRFCPVADMYWNARGGSHTDGGSFTFSLERQERQEGPVLPRQVRQPQDRALVPATPGTATSPESDPGAIRGVWRRAIEVHLQDASGQALFQMVTGPPRQLVLCPVSGIPARWSTLARPRTTTAQAPRPSKALTLLTTGATNRRQEAQPRAPPAAGGPERIFRLRPAIRRANRQPLRWIDLGDPREPGAPRPGESDPDHRRRRLPARGRRLRRPLLVPGLRARLAALHRYSSGASASTAAASGPTPTACASTSTAAPAITWPRASTAWRSTSTATPRTSSARS